MNDVGFPVAAVLEGIEAAAEAGLGPIKVNAVVKRGANEQRVVDLARHFKGTSHIVFIEYMDVGTTNGWRLDDVVPAEEMISAINQVFLWSRSRPTTRGRWPAGSGTLTARVR